MIFGQDGPVEGGLGGGAALIRTWGLELVVSAGGRGSRRGCSGSELDGGGGWVLAQHVSLREVPYNL